eukprot:6538505-Prymnesium_polylepis.1
MPNIWSGTAPDRPGPSPLRGQRPHRTLAASARSCCRSRGRACGARSPCGARRAVGRVGWQPWRRG